MAIIDLTTQSGVGINVVEDDLNSITTINFFDSTGIINLGSLMLDQPIYRSLMEALATIAKTFRPDSPTEPRYAKTTVSFHDKTSTVGF